MAIVKAVRHPGRSSSKVAKQCGISRQRVHQVLNAFDAGGMKAVALKSRASHTHPQAVPDKLRAEIVTIRRQLTWPTPSWLARTEWEMNAPPHVEWLKEDGVEPPVFN